MRVPLESLDDMTEPLIRVYPRILNDAIGCLLLPQHITLFHGKERAPLTALAHAVAISAARIEDARCVYLDSGTNYSPQLIRAFCDSKSESVELLKRIIVGPVFGLDDILEKIDLLQEMDAISIIVLDSLTGALNLTGEIASRSRQRKLFGALDSVRRIVNKLDTHLMITDHSSRNWVSGEPTPIGGNVLSHAVDSVVLVDKLHSRNDLTRILIERSPCSTNPSGVIIRVGFRGIRTIR